MCVFEIICLKFVFPLNVDLLWARGLCSPQLRPQAFPWWGAQYWVNGRIPKKNNGMSGDGQAGEKATSKQQDNGLQIFEDCYMEEEPSQWEEGQLKEIVYGKNSLVQCF